MKLTLNYIVLPKEYFPQTKKYVCTMYCTIYGCGRVATFRLYVEKESHFVRICILKKKVFYKKILKKY